MPSVRFPSILTNCLSRWPPCIEVMLCIQSPCVPRPLTTNHSTQSHIYSKAIQRKHQYTYYLHYHSTLQTISAKKIFYYIIHIANPSDFNLTFDILDEGMLNHWVVTFKFGLSASI